MTVSPPGTPRALQQRPDPETAEEVVLMLVRQLLEARQHIEQDEPVVAYEAILTGIGNWAYTKHYDSRVYTEFPLLSAP